jgi:integrase
VITLFFRLAGLASPAGTENVRLELRRFQRRKTTRHKQALGLNSNIRDALFAACGSGIEDTRNRALVAVGYDTLCRRSEIVALQAEDISPRQKGGATILVRRAKNDPLGKGRIAELSPEAYKVLQVWLDAAGIEKGLIFRAVYRNVVVKHRGIGPQQVPKILRRLARRAGLNEEIANGLTGHSMRVGAAQDLAYKGRDLGLIMRAGGWKSPDMAARYVEAAELRVWS